MSEPVAVTIECPCPDKPHESDTVSLRAKMHLAGGSALQSLFTDHLRAATASDQMPDWNAITGWMTEGYLLNGIVAWTLVDAEGKPLEVTQQTIRSVLLDDFELAQPVAQVADSLYYEAVLAPLVRRLSESLQSSQTSGSTSPTKSSKAETARRRSPSTRRSSKRPTPLRPSSTSTTQTASTAATLVALAPASTG